jgi:hypothetical protein
VEHSEIVVFRKFSSAIEASIAKAKLDAHDIPCFLSEENLTTLYTPLLSGGVRLHIFKQDQDHATQLLGELRSDGGDEAS